MARRCTICTHPNRTDIDKALVAGEESNRRIATQYDVKEAALRRHKKGHLPEVLVKAQEAEEAANGDDLLASIRNLSRQAQVIKDKAEEAGDLKTALQGIRELVRIVELMAKIRGELDERPVINIVTTPQWVELRTVILTALKPFPEARTAIAEAIEPNGTSSN